MMLGRSEINIVKRLVYSDRISVFQQELSDQNEYICVLPQV